MYPIRTPKTNPAASNITTFRVARLPMSTPKMAAKQKPRNPPQKTPIPRLYHRGSLCLLSFSFMTIVRSNRFNIVKILTWTLVHGGNTPTGPNPRRSLTIELRHPRRDSLRWLGEDPPNDNESRNSGVPVLALALVLRSPVF